MRTKMAVALVAILVALSFAGVAFAAAKTVTGEVVSADPTAKTLTINAEGKGMTFTVAAKAVKTLDTCKPSDKVTVSYTEADDGTLTAQSIKKG